MALELDDSLDSLLDKNLDDIADLPEWKNFPAGAHKSIVNWETKDAKWTDKEHGELEGKVIVCKLTAVETLELTDPKNDKPLEKGTQATVQYNPFYEQSLGALKAVLKNMEPVVGSSNLKALIQGTEGFEVIAFTTVRKYKKDGESKEQMKIQEFHPSV